MELPRRLTQPEIQTARRLAALGLTAVAITLALTIASADPTQDARPTETQAIKEAAASALARQGFNQAISDFRKVLRSTPTGDVVTEIEATLGLATALHYASPTSPARLAEAEALYERVADNPEASMAMRAQAMLALGRLAELRDFTGDVTDFAAADLWYGRVIDEATDLDAADEAMLWRTNLVFQQHVAGPELLAAFEALEAWANQRSDERPLRPVLYEYLGIAAMQSDMPELAMRNLRAADALGFADESFTPQGWWLIARLAERTGDLPLAVSMYQRIIREAPRTGRSFEAQLRLHELRAELNDPTIEVPALRSPHSPDDPLAVPASSAVPEGGGDE